jgi:hypothetical protein
MTDDWWTLQCRTSLNVECPRWMDWFHGGCSSKSSTISSLGCRATLAARRAPT